MARTATGTLKGPAVGYAADADRVAGALAVSGVSVLIVLRSGWRLHVEIVEPPAAGCAVVIPWGRSRPISIDVEQIATATSAEVHEYRRYREICKAQRAALEGANAPDLEAGGIDV